MGSEQPLLTVGQLVKQINEHERAFPLFLKQCASALCEMTDRAKIAELAWQAQCEAGNFRAFWETVDAKDPGIRLFAEALKASGMEFRPNDTVLEIGCCEANWIQPALKADPTLKIVGVDWRAIPVQDGGIRIRGDARNPELFCPSQFDWIVSLSAIEHMGLGHYDKDPVDLDGDTVVMQNVVTWVKEGGGVYLDVPYSANGYQVVGTHHRIYDDAAIQRRLLVPGLQEVWRGYALSDPVTLTPDAAANREAEFVYCALVARKVPVLNGAGGCAPMVQS